MKNSALFAACGGVIDKELAIGVDIEVLGIEIHVIGGLGIVVYLIIEMNEFGKIEMSAELAADIRGICNVVTLVVINSVVGLCMVALLKSVDDHTVVQTIAQDRAEIITIDR